MGLPPSAGQALEEAALEFEMLIRRGATHDEMLARARALRARLEAQNGPIKAAVDLLRYRYITQQTLREYPRLPGQLFTPPAVIETDDEAAARAAKSKP